jgi:hypothetical protein
MKIPRILIILSMLTLLLGVATMSASAQLFSYTTGSQVVNLRSSTATIVITYYNQDGSVANTVNDTIAGNSSKTYFPVATGFNGSAVISSDQPLGAVTNILNSTNNAGGAYVARSQGGTTVNLPLLMKLNGAVPYTTWFSVQNAGSADANVSVDYSDCAGTANASATIKAGASHVFNQGTEACHTAKVFAGTVTSDQPVVVVAVEENSTPKIFAYTGFDSGSTNPVMPLINANNSGITTGVQIQNAGGSNTQVTVSYTHSLAGTDCTETQTIPAGGSKTFALVAFNNPNTGTTTTCVAGERFIGSAKVTANSASQPLMAIVNQSKPLYGEAYGAFDPASATPVVVMPLIMDRNGARSYSTGFSVMNVGSASTFVKCSFTGTSYTASGQVAPNGALVDQQATKIGVGYVGSATCKTYTDNTYGTVDTNGKIVSVVNELGLTTADRFLVYEGINDVVVP